jgi:hypothetical protein
VPGRNLFTVGKVLERGPTNPPRNRFLVVALAVSLLLLLPQPVWAYGGPGAGLEFIPYFVSLLIWAGFALAAVVMWPVYPELVADGVDGSVQAALTLAHTAVEQISLDRGIARQP